MCGGHLQRSDGAWTRSRVLGTHLLFLLLLLGAGGLPLRGLAAEESDEEDEEEGEEEEEEAPPEVEEQLRVEERREPGEALEPHPASVVRIELDESIAPSASLADVLEPLAGIHVRRFGGPGDPSYLTIRGSTSRQVEVWVDGIPLNSQGSSVVDLSELPLDAYDRVEVWRGFGPAELGASPIGGVVHLTTRPGVAARPRFEAGIGSWETRHAFVQGGAAGRSGPTVGDVRLSVGYAGTGGSYPWFDNGGTLIDVLDDRTRTRSNNHHDRLDAVVRARLDRGPFQLSLTDQFHWSDGGVPGPGSRITTESRFGVLQNLLAGAAILQPEARVSLRGDLSWRFRRELYSDPLGELGLGLWETRDRLHQPVGGLSVQLQPLPWLGIFPSARTVVDVLVPVDARDGIQVGSTRVRAATTVSIGSSLTPWDGLLTVLPAVGLVLVDNRLLGNVPFQDVPIASDGEELSAEALPRLAVAVRPVRFLTIRAAVARGYRPPTFTELFGNQGGLVGNASLRPETAHSFDASVRVAGALEGVLSGSAELGYYRSDAVDRIVFRPNGQKLTTPVNFGASTIQGIEAGVDLRVLDLIVARAALTWADSRITQGEAAYLGKRLPNVPEWELDIAAGIEWGSWLRATWHYHHAAGTYDSQTNLFLQAPRSLHSVVVRAQPGRDWPWAAVELHNLGNSTVAPRYRDPLNPSDDDRVVVAVEDFRGNPLPGRSFLVSVGWTLPRKKRPADEPPPTEESTP